MDSYDREFAFYLCMMVVVSFALGAGVTTLMTCCSEVIFGFNEDTPQEVRDKMGPSLKDLFIMAYDYILHTLEYISPMPYFQKYYEDTLDGGLFVDSFDYNIQED